MGRKRIDPEDKKERISIALTKSLIDRIKKDHKNVSEFIEKFIKKYYE